MSEYIPVPVEAAKALAHKFHKHAVVILSLDDNHKVTHTTTYGVNAFYKENAAAVGDICTKAIGGDLSQRIDFEDYHKNYEPARHAEAVALLEQIANTPDATCKCCEQHRQQIQKFLTSK